MRTFMIVGLTLVLGFPASLAAHQEARPGGQKTDVGIRVVKQDCVPGECVCIGTAPPSARMNEIGPRPEELARGVRCLVADFDGNGAVDYAIPGAEGRATILMRDEAGGDQAFQINAGGFMELYEPRASVGPLGEPVSRNHGILVRWVGQDHAVFVWSGKGFDRKLFSAACADDRARLLELHAEAMEAHCAEDVDLQE